MFAILFLCDFARRIIATTRLVLRHMKVRVGWIFSMIRPRLVYPISILVLIQRISAHGTFGLLIRSFTSRSDDRSDLLAIKLCQFYPIRCVLEYDFRLLVCMVFGVRVYIYLLALIGANITILSLKLGCLTPK